MANEPYSSTPTIEPDTALPDVSQHLRANPNTFGAQIGQATEQAGQQFGSALSKVGATYNEVAADDASNQFQSAADKLLHGDPEKPITNPDGTQSPDLGFMGLKGADAMRAAPAYNKKLDELLKKTRSGLLDLDQMKTFDNYSRRYRGVIISQMGTHADTQSLNYAQETNVATAKINLNKISVAPDDEEGFKHASEDTVNAYVKTAMLKGAKPGDPLYEEAVTFGKRDAMTARLEAISVNDPARALKMTEDNKGTLGVNYDNLSNKFRARADTQTGNAVGDAAVASSGATIKPSGGRVSPSTVHKAIVGQESGGQQFDKEGKVLTSVDGAQGAGQMLPATFQKYALPGEVITNREDNLAASRRAIDDYYRKYNGDAGRVAVAYFSGEGNVAPAGSPTPWINDAKDGNGKSVSSYVGDIQGRLGVTSGATPVADTGATPASGGTTAAVQSYAQMESNATAKILGMHLPPAQEAHALQRVRTTFQSARVADEQTKAAAKERNDQAADGWVKLLLGPVTPGRDLVHEIANDPNLTWEARNALGNAAEKHAGTDAQAATATYGPGFWDAYKAVNLPPGDPNRISDPTTLLNRAGPKGDLTLAGVEKLTRTMKEGQTSVDGQSVNTSKTGLLGYAKSKLSFEQDTGPIKIRDPKGEALFNAEFIPKFESAYAQWVKDGKDPWQFLTRENVDKMLTGMRNTADMARERLLASGEALPEGPAAPAPPPPPNTQPEAWNRIVSNPPTLADGKKFPAADWGRVVGMLVPAPANLQAADAELHLTPEEKALYQRHLTNLAGAGGVNNPDGSRSTLYDVTTEIGGKTYVLPSVYDGKILKPDEAIARARQEGLDKFPSYATEKEAEARYDKLHAYMEKDTRDYQSKVKQFNESKFGRAGYRAQELLERLTPRPTAPSAPIPEPSRGMPTPMTPALSLP